MGVCSKVSMAAVALVAISVAVVVEAAPAPTPMPTPAGTPMPTPAPTPVPCLQPSEYCDKLFGFGMDLRGDMYVLAYSRCLENFKDIVAVSDRYCTMGVCPSLASAAGSVSDSLLQGQSVPPASQEEASLLQHRIAPHDQGASSEKTASLAGETGASHATTATMFAWLWEPRPTTRPAKSSV